ncbi:MAG: zinc-ribbon domain-containing protein, partial [Acidobacteria bacterium]|nr:zinc-ribbon domain-containing protein [Acidobacteriota bacterium]
MLCTKCGSACPEGNSFCQNCGAVLGESERRPSGLSSDNSAQTIS